MYRPKMFDVDDITEQHAIIRDHGFAQLTTGGPAGLVATHLPLHLLDGGDRGILWGHVAKANDHWQVFDGQTEALAVFSGPHSYISPTWYETQKSVPTWNYEAVHAYGRPRLIEQPDRVVQLLSSLTAQYEGSGGNAWKVRDLPEDFVAAQLKGIVAFEMPIERLEGKRKMSQNRKPEDVKGAMAGLHALGGEEHARVAEIMAKSNRDRLDD